MQTVDNEEKRICEERTAFWTSVYPGWPFMSNRQRKRMKKMYKNSETKCVPKTPTPPTYWAGCECIATDYHEFDFYAEMMMPEAISQKKEEDKTMDNTNREAKERLNSRLRTLYHAKNADARKTFLIDDDVMPATGQEMIDRLAKGLYVYDKDSEAAFVKEHDYLYGWSQFIQWRDPAKPADEVGFKAFAEKLEEAYEATKDDIIVKEPVAGLDALRAFKTLVIA